MLQMYYSQHKMDTASVNSLLFSKYAKSAILKELKVVSNKPLKKS